MADVRKGHLRQRNNVLEQIEAENAKRVFLTALGSLLFFGLSWLLYLISCDTAEQQEKAQLGLQVSLPICLILVIVSYYFLFKRKKQFYRVVYRIFWGIEMCLLTMLVAFAKSRLESMLFLATIMFSMAWVPILEFREQVVEGIFISGIVLTQWYVGVLDAEHSLYAFLWMVMSLVIGRQSYKTYYRKVEDASTIHSVTSQAETDPMTLLLNRRGLERRLANIWPMCVRQKLQVAVIMLDIDNFKKYNDSFGHAAGDDCIRKVTAILRKQIRRKTDYAARVGGEEFLLFLTGISQEETVLFAKKCKQEVEGLHIKQAENNFLPFVSVSMGIAHGIPGDKWKEFWEFRNEADRGLYQAKENGRASIYMDSQCFAKTLPDRNRRQFMKGQEFRSI